MNTRAQAFMADPALQAVYVDWLKHPGTRLVREIMEEIVTLLPLQNPTGEMALYKYGFGEGCQTVKDFLFDMAGRLQALKEQQVVSALPADYGAEGIMAQNGLINRKEQSTHE